MGKVKETRKEGKIITLEQAMKEIPACQGNKKLRNGLRTFMEFLPYSNDSNKHREMLLLEQKHLHSCFIEAGEKQAKWRKDYEEGKLHLHDINEFQVDMDGTIYLANCYGFLSAIALGEFDENEAQEIWNTIKLLQKKLNIAITYSSAAVMMMVHELNWGDKQTDVVVKHVKNSGFNHGLIKDLHDAKAQGKKIHLATMNYRKVAMRIADELGLEFDTMVASDSNAAISIMDYTFTFEGETYVVDTKIGNKGELLLTDDLGFDVISATKIPIVKINNNHNLDERVERHRPFFCEVEFGERVGLVA